MDAAFIKECADASLKPAVVEQFVSAVGSSDPLAITVKSGGRLILVPKPKTTDEAMDVVRQYAGQAVVRVGMTQLPAGVGVKDVSELRSDLFDPCENLRKGTGMFARILRIVRKWYGNPTSGEVFPPIFEDAVHAWNSGEFEGQRVFQAEEPGGPITAQKEEAKNGAEEPDDAESSGIEEEDQGEKHIGTAGIRVDLSRINGR